MIGGYFRAAFTFQLYVFPFSSVLIDWIFHFHVKLVCLKRNLLMFEKYKGYHYLTLNNVTSYNPLLLIPKKCDILYCSLRPLTGGIAKRFVTEYIVQFKIVWYANCFRSVLQRTVAANDDVGFVRCWLAHPCSLWVSDINFPLFGHPPEGSGVCTGHGPTGSPGTPRTAHHAYRT